MKSHPESNDQHSFKIHNHPYLPPTDYRSHQQYTLDILGLLVVEFTQVVVHHY